MPEQRKYTVGEIDRMRSEIEWSYPSGPYNAIERNADIENRLRTHMQNGTTPEELASHYATIRAMRRAT